MKITDIKQQVKRADRYSIYIDGKYSFSLSANELLNQHLKIGQELNRSQYNEMQQKALEDKAYMRSLDLLARRSRSEWEMEHVCELGLVKAGGVQLLSRRSEGCTLDGECLQEMISFVC